MHGRIHVIAEDLTVFPVNFEVFELFKSMCTL